MPKLKKLNWSRQDFLPDIIDEALDKNDIEQLNHCCGVGEIGNFPGLEELFADVEEEMYLNVPDEVAAPVKIADVKRRLGASGFGLLLATTNQNQKEASAALALVGFRVLSVTRNPKTRSTITLWGYEVPRGKKGA